MEDGSKPPLISLFVLLIFSFYLAFVETALASVSKNRIKISADRGDSRAEHALFALENFDRAITTILICNNIVSVSIATIVTVFVTNRWGVSLVSLSTIITTIVIFFACEMLPKSLAKKYSFKAMLFCADLLYIMMVLFKPTALLLVKIGNYISSKIKTKPEASVTEDEIQDFIEDMEEEGAIDAQQSELLSSAIEFGDLRLKKIYTKTEDIVGIDINKTPEEVLSFLRAQTHSRIPVYEKTITNIVGILQVRKYMKKYMEKSEPPKIKNIMDKAHYFSYNTEINQLLHHMSKCRINMAVVTNDKNKTLGIVTIEDILEELVGDIWDEHDTVNTEAIQ